MAAPFDVIVFGPTGVTGREVVRYLDQRATQVGATWAVAGRDRARIDAVLDRLGATPDGVVLADVTDKPSIEAMVERARVVVNLVGPYTQYGEPVHAACARAGVHQLDLTGEIDWVRLMIERYGSTAEASGATILPCAGFESLPFDLAALLAASTAHQRGRGWSVTDVDAAVTFSAPGTMAGVTDAVSGGTFASLVEILRSGRSGLPDPHALDPTGSRRTRGYDLRPRRHSGSGAWLAPLFPSPLINPPVLHRTAGLLRGDGDGMFTADYRYREGTGHRVHARTDQPARHGACRLRGDGIGSVGRDRRQLLPRTFARRPRRRPIADRPSARHWPTARHPRRLVVPDRRAGHDGERRDGRRPRRGAWPSRLQVDRDARWRSGCRCRRPCNATSRLRHARHRARRRQPRQVRPCRRPIRCRRAQLNLAQTSERARRRTHPRRRDGAWRSGEDRSWCCAGADPRVPQGPSANTGRSRACRLRHLDASGIDEFDMHDLIHHDKRSAAELWNSAGERRPVGNRPRRR